MTGDPSGLAEAYDRYAALLYTYCCTLLREPADAADAVQDTFVIASSRLAGLRDPSRLRAWLFAVARNECLRRLRDKRSTSAFDEDADVTDETADVGGHAERAELRALVQAAIRGLGDADRDVIVLQLSQGLDAAEIAAVLGVSRNHAHALLSRARDHLQACVGALLVGRTGRRDCPQLDSLLSDWDGHLTVLLRKRLNRHIQHCATCESRRDLAFSPAMILEGGAAVAAALMAVPPALRAKVLRLATGHEGAAVAHQAAVLAKATPFGKHGFPRPAYGPKGAAHHGAWHHASYGHAALAAGAGAVVTVAIALAPFTRTWVPRLMEPPSGGPAPAQATWAPSPSMQEVAATSRTGPPPGGTSSPPPGGASSPPTAGKALSPASSPTPSTPTPLAVAPAGGDLQVHPGRGVTITLTASWGPVSWSVTGTPALPDGQFSVSPASGVLAAGQSVTLTVRANALANGEVVTIIPGGTTFTVSVVQRNPGTGGAPSGHPTQGSAPAGGAPSGHPTQGSAPAGGAPSRPAT